MGFGNAVVQLLSAAIAGGIGGYLVLAGVNRQFHRQSEAACQALLLEVQSNYKALAEMVEVPRGQPWPDGRANPGRLNRSVWDTQLPYVVQILDARTLKIVVEAYAALDSVPEMRLPGVGGPGSRYARGGWIDDDIAHSYEKFNSANGYLGDFVAEQGKSRWTRLRQWRPWAKFGAV